MMTITLALRVGELPTQQGPDYATACCAMIYVIFYVKDDTWRQ